MIALPPVSYARLALVDQPVGWNAQYAGAVAPRRRLAPHAHFAMCGTIPHELVRRVAAATTYHPGWWSPVDVRLYEPVQSAAGLEWLDLGQGQQVFVLVDRMWQNTNHIPAAQGPIVAVSPVRRRMA